LRSPNINEVCLLQTLVILDYTHLSLRFQQSDTSWIVLITELEDIDSLICFFRNCRSKNCSRFKTTWFGSVNCRRQCRYGLAVNLNLIDHSATWCGTLNMFFLFFSPLFEESHWTSRWTKMFCVHLITLHWSHLSGFKSSHWTRVITFGWKNYDIDAVGDRDDMTVVLETNDKGLMK
jgi:hypothetical protein